MNRELKIGLSVILAIVLIYLSIAWVKRVHFFAPAEKAYTLSFDHVAGLLEGDPVYVRGYLAGRVTQITPEAKAVSVRVMVNTRIQLFEDAHAEIQLKELMSGKQVTLFQGEKSQPLAADQVIQGTASLDFGSGFSAITQIAQGLPPERIQAMLNQLDSVFSSANHILSEIDPNSINQLITQAGNSLNDIQRLTQEARDRQLIAKIDTTINHTTQLMSKAEQSMDKLSSMADEINTQQIDTLLQNMIHLSQEGEVLVGDIRQLLSQLQNKEALAGKMLQDPAFARQLDSTLIHLDQVLMQIRDEKIYISVGKNKRGDK